jgi:P-loop Domain of unknown function (DUF2791)
MQLSDLDEETSLDIIDKLRNGLPPRRYASLYSSGMETFVANVRKHHLDRRSSSGRIRFVSGSWGSGKTHLFRLLAEQAFNANYLVSTVELSRNEAPFNKFELVLASILRNIASHETEVERGTASPLGEILRLHLFAVADRDEIDFPSALAAERDRILADTSIDIDMRRVVVAYWETFWPDPTIPGLSERRGQMLQWFTGEANKSTMRSEFGVQRVLNKENSRAFLTSVVALAKFLGFRGLLVLFDESEMSHSTMAKSQLNQAHNNLLHLINEIDTVAGLVMIYAAVPAFFNDDRHGIRIYGALASRIGEPEPNPPSALQRVWNLDAVTVTPHQFRGNDTEISEIYTKAFPDDITNLMTTTELLSRINIVIDEHGQYEKVSKWRAVVQECVKLLDLTLEGGTPLDPRASYRETKKILERFGDD